MRSTRESWDNVDILSFINSEDIADYLWEIDYRFDSMQAAWLVYQSVNRSFDEKHEAWSWIINRMPDCEMPETRDSIFRPSLHAFLEEMMAFRDSHRKRIEGGKSPKPEGRMTDEEWDLYRDTFESRWYCFPTPFEKGDIVYDCRRNPHDRDSVCGGTFVLDYISNREDDRKRRKRGDTTDMNAYGWFSDPDGTIYKEVMSNYMDLVLFRGTLNGQERIQIGVSNYLKGKIDVELLLQSQRTLILRDYGKESVPNWYTDEDLVLAGIANLPCENNNKTIKGGK